MPDLHCNWIYLMNPYLAVVCFYYPNFMYIESFNFLFSLSQKGKQRIKPCLKELSSKMLFNFCNVIKVDCARPQLNAIVSMSSLGLWMTQPRLNLPPFFTWNLKGFEGTCHWSVQRWQLVSQVNWLVNTAPSHYWTFLTHIGLGRELNFLASNLVSSEICDL